MERDVINQAVRAIADREGKYLTFVLAGEEYGIGILKGADIEDAPNFSGCLNTAFILGMAKTNGAVKILLDIDRVFRAEEINVSAGAGFAVVADEVRNLALRAAEAARNTNSLIENTIKTVRQGGEITQATRDAFRENVANAGKVAQLIDEIASASDEQAQGIDQINKAVSEMDNVIQQTAASAEEFASSSEELTAQAEQMRGYVSDLATVIAGRGKKSGGAAHALTPIRRDTEISPAHRQIVGGRPKEITERNSGRF